MSDTLGITSLTPDDVTKLREAMTARASIVLIESAVVCDVTDVQGMVILLAGNLSLHLDNFAAELLGRELIGAAVKCAAKLEEQGIEPDAPAVAPQTHHTA
jgi:hypothetical protein